MIGKSADKYSQKPRSGKCAGASRKILGSLSNEESHFLLLVSCVLTSTMLIYQASAGGLGGDKPNESESFIIVIVCLVCLLLSVLETVSWRKYL